MEPPAPTDRERDLAAIRDAYGRYRSEGRGRIWDPGNPGFARIIGDRDRELVALLRASLPTAGGRVLDIGCGDGRLAALVRDAGMSEATWSGVDLDPDAVDSASGTMPWGTWLVGSADQLPLDDASFDAVVASTLFSSLPSREMERAVASEVARVLRPGGWLVWYDLRYDNPANRAVHGVARSDLARLFPKWPMELRSTTLLPPLARRLGPLTGLLYRPLELLPPLRSHLIGRLAQPTA